MSEEGYSFVEPFDIDHGELDGLAPEQCFVLGVEREMCLSFIEHPDHESMQIHSANLRRILRMARRRGVELAWEDHGDGWATIKKEGKA